MQRVKCSAGRGVSTLGPSGPLILAKNLERVLTVNQARGGHGLGPEDWGDRSAKPAPREQEGILSGQFRLR